MKIFLTSLIFSLSCLFAIAQQDRFIYLQTENKQPFFVKLNGKVLNSYPMGYLIIPKLDDGLYSLVIGFPGTTDEQEFNCSIDKKDIGFIIKNVTEKGWQLFNVQTNNVIVPGDLITKPVIVYEKETDPFSTMLANAVHDSTILRKDVAKEVVTEKPADQVVKDTAAITTDVVVSNTVTTSLVDSAAKDLAKQTLPEKSNELKDSSLTVSTPNVVIANENVVPDSAKKDIAKEVIPEKTNDPVTKGSMQTVNSDVVVLKPDSLNDVTKQTLPERSNELVQKDSIQTMDPGNELVVNKTKKRKSRKNDNALQDSSIAKTDTVKEIIPENSIEKKDNDQVINSAKDLALLRTVVKRRSRKTSKEGLEMVYIDDTGDAKDTIRVLIPKKEAEETKTPDSVITAVTTTVQQDDQPKENIADKNKSDYKVTKQEKEIIKEANKEPVFISTMINSDCKNFATDADFLKVRKKMVAEDNDDDMIKAAKKIFKTKCFTTEQIKNLSVLFLKDEGKYMFFDAAYPFVSDSDVYAGLEKQLTDEYYITRFRAMIHK